jgi:uncharacterized protein involved in exopolysaccharide biosynthesis
MWWHSIAISALVGMLVGLGVYHTRPGAYKATASILLNDQPDVLGALIGTTAPPSPEVDQGQRDRLLTIMSSKMLRRRLVDRFDLAARFELPPGDAAEQLGYMTKLEQMGGGLSVTVTCMGYRKPAMAWWMPLSLPEASRLCAELANGYITELESYLEETAIEQAGSNYDFVEDAKSDLEQELADAEDRLEQLQMEFELLDPDEKALRVVDRINAAERAYSEAAALADETASSLASARSQLRQVDALHVASVVEQRNPVISQLEGKLAELRTQMATETAMGKTEQHRDVAQLQVAIDDVEGQIAELSDEVRKETAMSSNPAYGNLVQTVTQLEVSHAGAVARRQKYAALLSQAKAALADLPPVAREYATLKRQQDAQATLAADLTQSLSLAIIERQRAEATRVFRVLDSATPPRWRSGPPTILFGAIAFAISFAILAFLMIDRRAFGMF